MQPSVKKPLALVALAAVLLIVADQAIKLWILSNLAPGESIRLTSWFYLCFVQNPGMAFGLDIFNKVALTTFRFFAVCFMCYGVYYCLKNGFKRSFAFALAMITAGALGNLVDCIFYAHLFYGGDYLVGKVVDMFYFPLIQSTWPSWVPGWGGSSLVFFRPVFNLADSAITCGVFFIVFFCYKDLVRLLSFDGDEDVEENTTPKKEN